MLTFQDVFVGKANRQTVFGVGKTGGTVALTSRASPLPRTFGNNMPQSPIETWLIGVESSTGVFVIS